MEDSVEYKLRNLTLRTVSHDDLYEVVRMWNFEKGNISLEEAEKAIIWMSENHKLNQLHKLVHFCLAIFENNTNRIIGWCGLDGRSIDNKTENRIHIFYLIDKDYRKLGYATECAKKVLEYGFEKIELGRIDGGCAKDNIGSHKILEKIGMKKIDNKNDDSYHYFMTLKDYTETYSDKTNN